MLSLYIKKLLTEILIIVSPEKESFSPEMKIARKTPIFKDKNDDEVQNYRFISVSLP